MSTITVVKKQNRVAIAADTFSTVGRMRTASKYITNHAKILRFGDSCIGLTGPSAHAHVFSSILRKYPKKLCFNGVSDIFETYLRLHPILKAEFYLKTEEEDDDEYESSQIEALIANPDGIFGMFSWRDVDEYTRFWAIGSGQEYALGAMYAVYEQLNDPEEIARIGVAAGCEFDDASGLPCTSYSVPLRKRKASSRKRSAKRVS